MNTDDYEQTLRTKITTLVESLRDTSRESESIHMDPTHLNDESAQYRDAMKKYIKLTNQIWALKQNW